MIITTIISVGTIVSCKILIIINLKFAMSMLKLIH